MLDFIDWVTTSRELVHRAFAAESQDDDFAKIDGGSSSSSYAATSPQGSYYSQYSVNESTPLLSKTAEAELYLLATNFLLCELSSRI